MPSETAPAKINLHLHVTGRRDDGYHELDSLVVFADIGDRLTAVADDGLSLAYTGPHADALPTPADNLVMTAAARLRSHFDVAAGARLTLEKNLPVASGIGGGSADAAAALRVLCRLWGLDPAAPEMFEIARGLGADVPVCLLGRPALMSGIGERLTPVSRLADMGLALINPGVAVSTPAVFKARTGVFSRPAPIFDGGRVPSGGFDGLVDALTATRNDLEPPAIALAPVIGDVLAALRGAPGIRLARMSGSGATCFGLARTLAEAERAAAALRGRHPSWWIAATAVLRC